MATRIDWSWDAIDGQLIKRFSRALACEAWLVGKESADTLDERYENVGPHILDRHTGQHRRRTMIAVPFTINPRRLDADKLTLVAKNGSWFGLPLNRILELCLPGDGSFPRQDALTFLRSLAPDPDETYVVLEALVAPGGRAIHSPFADVA